MMPGVQRHSRVESPKKPHGHGFIAAISMKLEGNLSVMVERAMVIAGFANEVEAVNQ